MPNTYRLNINLKETNILKGIALLLLLLHHLFYIQNGLYDDIHLYKGHYLVNELGILGKLCVAIFVFLSGYGLTIQANKNSKIQLGNFYKHRFTKLYLNYWFIWIVFVPIGVFFFQRTFDSIYINNVWAKLIIDLAGLSFACGFYGYNETSWFYSCIIILYLLFPFLYKLLRKHKFILIILALGVYISPLFIFNAIRQYLISFILGMIAAYGINIKYTFPYYKYVNKYTLLIIFIFSCILRNALGGYAILADSLICLIGVCLFKQITIWEPICKYLIFIGKHSMNIFLFHTFIYHYYYKEYIFFSRNPIIIYFTLLIICLVISTLLEIIKNKIGFYKIKI